MNLRSVMGAAACSVLAILAPAATAQAGYDYTADPDFIAERENKFVR
jgi:hypothetical protein